jgi:hypothetical protein
VHATACGCSSSFSQAATLAVLCLFKLQMSTAASFAQMHLESICTDVRVASTGHRDNQMEAA